MIHCNNYVFKTHAILWRSFFTVSLLLLEKIAYLHNFNHCIHPGGFPLKQLINGKIVIFPKFASRPPDVSSYITQMGACEKNLASSGFCMICLERIRKDTLG